MSAPTTPTVLVVGNGMAGHRFVEAAIERGLAASHRIVVVGEERRPAYDRVHLSSLFDGFGPDDLTLSEGCGRSTREREAGPGSSTLPGAARPLPRASHARLAP